MCMMVFAFVVHIQQNQLFVQRGTYKFISLPYVILLNVIHFIALYVILLHTVHVIALCNTVTYNSCHCIICNTVTYISFHYI